MDKQNTSPVDAPRPASVPTAVLAARALFTVSAIAWLLFATYTLLGLDTTSADQVTTMWIIGVLMLVNTLAMLWVAAGLGKQQRRFYYPALLLMVMNIVLTVTDQMGVFDWAVLVLDAAILVLLLATGKLYKA